MRRCLFSEWRNIQSHQAFSFTIFDLVFAEQILSDKFLGATTRPRFCMCSQCDNLETSFCRHASYLAFVPCQHLHSLCNRRLKASCCKCPTQRPRRNSASDGLVITHGLIGKWHLVASRVGLCKAAPGDGAILWGA